MGSYYLDGRLGAGGQGVVFEGYDVDGRRVAVKVLREVADGDRDALGKELRAWRRVAPFCTTRVLDDDLDGPVPFVVSEYVPGPDLRRAVDEEGPYEPEELLRLAIGVATALVAVHRAGVVHRDLKPENILLGPDGPRVIDFGIARIVEGTSTTGMPMGTLRYMPPERYSGQSGDSAVDVWGWGAVVLFAATGRHAFDASHAAALTWLVATHEPDTSMLAEPLRPLVTAALSKDPRDRPTSEELLLSLVGRADLAEAVGRAGPGRAARAGGSVEPTRAEIAEEVYAGLDPRAQETVPAVMLRLVAPGSRAEDTLRSARRTEFSDGPTPPETLERVIDAYTAAGVLVWEGEEVSLSGAALIRSWPRLRDWVEAERAGLAVHQRLAETARLWDDHGRRKGDVLQGTALERVSGWAATGRRHLALNDVERAFLEAGARLTRRRGRVRAMFTAIVSVLLVFAVGAAAVAFDQQRAAVRERDTVRYQQILANADRLRDTDLSPSAQLALAAHRMRPGEATATRLAVAANSPLSTSLPGIDRPVTGVAYGPDGKVLAVSLGVTDGSTVQLWNVADPARPALLSRFAGSGTNAVDSLAFSPDGKVLATGGSDRLVRLWNTADPAHPSAIGRPLEGMGLVWSVAFSPAGTFLAAAADTSATGSGVWLWNVADPAKPVLSRRVTTDDSRSLAFSRDGRRLAAVVKPEPGKYALRLWSLPDDAQPPVDGPTTAVDALASVAFAPDGRTLATGGIDTTVRLWNIGDPARITPATDLELPLYGHTAPLSALAFSPDGSMLLTGSNDHSARLWDVSRPPSAKALGQPLTGHTDIVETVAFSPDGRTVATGGLDHAVRLWTLPPAASARTGVGATFLEFSPDWRLMATGDMDDNLHLWDVSDPARNVALGSPLPDARWAVFSPDGRTLAVGGRQLPNGDFGYTVRLWDVSRPGSPTPLGPALPQVDSAVFSPDGRTLATTSGDKGGGPYTVRLWSLADPGHPQQVGRPLTEHGRQVLALAFSPDGHVLASGSRDRTVRLWAVSDPARITPLGPPLTGHIADVMTVRFAPDGRTLATGSADDSVRLWDVSDPGHPAPLGQPLTGHAQPVTDMRFRPDGRILATASYDGTVRLWDVSSPSTLPPSAQSLTGYAGGFDQVRFSPDGQTLATRNTNQTVQRWDLNTAHAIARVCATTRTALTTTTWRRYLGDTTPYTAPCA
ncbi:protein kinase [Streptomyces sp. NPDC029721]|uniref:WD40 repeat domain-containing serine/threonine protein kinase n=1 Tax=Streptomyces sp. NPDC029721 TaxID=3157090 RepID=UPI0033D61E9D